MAERRFVNIYRDKLGRYISDSDYDPEADARKFTDEVDVGIKYIETVEIVSLKEVL